MLVLCDWGHLFDGKKGKPCVFLIQPKNEVEPVSPGTLNPEPSQTCGVLVCCCLAFFRFFFFFYFFGGGGVEIEEKGCWVEGGLEESLRSMSPSLIISTTRTWYRVWQIRTLDDYSLSQPGWGSCSASAEGWERGRVKFTRVFP